MLEKKATLGLAKDEEGFILIDQKTKHGVKVENEAMLQLILAIWEQCDKLESSELAGEIIGNAPASDEQKETIKKVVEETLDFFVEAGWAVKKIVIATK